MEGVRKYLRIETAAYIYDFSERHLRDMCLQGKVKGATKVDSEWRIPVEAMDRMMESGIPENHREEATSGL